jgi:hypothetical protein
MTPILKADRDGVCRFTDNCDLALARPIPADAIVVTAEALAIRRDRRALPLRFQRSAIPVAAKACRARNASPELHPASWIGLRFSA